MRFFGLSFFHETLGLRITYMSNQPLAEQENFQFFSPPFFQLVYRFFA
jgi:hypothetical protein